MGINGINTSFLVCFSRVNADHEVIIPVSVWWLTVHVCGKYVAAVYDFLIKCYDDRHIFRFGKKQQRRAGCRN